MIAGSFATIIATGLKRTAAGDEGAECAWGGGETLEGIVDEWSGSKSAIKEMQEASALLLKNPNTKLTSRGLNRASQFMTQINKSKPVSELYRGMGVSNAEAKRLLTQTGKKFSLPLTSTSFDPSIAEQFTTSYQLGSAPDVALMMEIRGARAFDITDLVPDQFSDQAEAIIMGNFRVVEVTQQGNNMHMLLEAI